jgi:hypothetical protein
MRINEFFSEVAARQIEVQFDYADAAPAQRLSNEALFHLPLIAITILMLSKGHVKPFVDEIGQLVGDCYERAFTGFRWSAQHLGWSGSLRVRTVQALAFLEQAQLVDVDQIQRKVSATGLGRNVLELAISTGGDLASTLVAVDRGYRDLRIERQLRLRPE